MAEYEVSVLVPTPKGLGPPRQSIGMQFGTGTSATWQGTVPITLGYSDSAGVAYYEYVPLDQDHNIPRAWQTDQAHTDAADVRVIDVVGGRWFVFALATLHAGITDTVRLYVIEQANWQALAEATDVLKIEYQEQTGQWYRAQTGGALPCGFPCISRAPTITRMAGCSTWRLGGPHTCIGSIGPDGDVSNGPLGAIVDMAMDPDGRTLWLAERASTDQVSTLYVRGLDTITWHVRHLYGPHTTVFTPGLMNPDNLPTGGAPMSVGLCAGHGGVYLANGITQQVLFIDGITGAVTLIAGNGSGGTGGGGTWGTYTGDGGAATAAGLSFPLDVMLNNAGTHLYISDCGNRAVRMVDLGTGIITTIIGGLAPSAGPPTGLTNTNQGNGGPGTSAALNWPGTLYVDPRTDFLYIAQPPYGAIRVWNPATGIIDQVIGPVEPAVLGSFGGFALPYWVYQSDGPVPLGASAGNVVGISVDTCGNVLYVDGFFGVVRSIVCGNLKTLAGNAPFSDPQFELVVGETVLGATRSIEYPSAAVPAPGGGLYVAAYAGAFPGLVVNSQILFLR